MTFAEIKTKSQAEQERMLAESQAVLMKLERDVHAGQLKTVHQVKAARRNIAQIMTALRQHA